MKHIITLLCAILFLVACSSTKQVKKSESKENTREVIAEDQSKYGVEMFNEKFLKWYERYKNPVHYRDQSYYELWNKQYVIIWNRKANNSVENFPYDPVVGYNSNEDYGFELNHKLFHYFMYVENVLKIQVMPGGPDFKILKP